MAYPGCHMKNMIVKARGKNAWEKVDKRMGADL